MAGLSLVVAVLLLAAQAGFSAQTPAEPPSISGVVLDPDGTPVTSGIVALVTTSNSRVTAAINRLGEFRIAPDAVGPQALFISAPGLAPYRANLNVPVSRRMTLPAIQLLQATYFRARFISADGEPLGGTIRRRSLDADGFSMPDPLDHVRERVDNDGTVTIGPLPLGRTLLAFDRSGLAQTRLPDAIVNGSQPLIDVGPVGIGAGGTLQVDVADAAGAAVPQHNVWIEDALQPSPLFFSPLKTGAQGRAEFTRLAAGRYRVWTQTAERCGVQPLSVTRLASSSGSGNTHVRLVIDGSARLRLTSALGPLIGKFVTISPEAPAETPWQPRFSNPIIGRAVAMQMSRGGCQGSSDGDGRVSIPHFPPGPADVRIPLINSTYLARINVPPNGSELVIAIPDGLIPVKLIDEASRDPIGGALVRWTGGGSRVEAVTNANGDALLEAVGVTGGTLALSGNGYETVEGSFAETPGTHQEIALKRSPLSRVIVRVQTVEGGPIAGAAVMLTSSRPGDPVEIATTDATGAASFANVPPGSLRLTASAEGFARAQQSIVPADRAAATLMLKREP